MYKTALLLAVLASAHAQLTSDGTCNFTNITTELHINLLNYTMSENYYEIKRINNAWNTGHCTSGSLAVNSITKTASIIVKEVVNRKLIERNTTITLQEEEKNYYNVVFKDFNSNFTILGVGDRYFVIYACSDVGQQKQEYAWVVSSNTTLTENEKNTTENIIRNNNLNNASWVETSHTDEACESGGTNIKLSPIIVLIFGFFMSKVL